MGFASRKDLRDLYISGTFRKAVTINFPEIYGSPVCPPEALVADANGRVIGECWTCDLEELVAYGENEHSNTGLFNPNLPVIKQALETMRAIRKDVAKVAQEAAAPRTARIFQFPIQVSPAQDNNYGDADISPFSNPGPS